ncbi:MAG TPA: tetratricopeptide repeat protein [Thermoanaerobaculia bacterium]|nr:tetratricopeptide repeat protein [Thermoanaerobaculia bacterium]
MAVSLATVATILVFALAPRSRDHLAPPGAPSPEVPLIDDLGALDRSFQAAVDGRVAAVRRDPTSGEAYGELGRLYHAHGYFALAGRSYEIAHGLAPQAAAWPYYLGVLASGRGQTGEAIESLRRALSLDPGYLATYLRLGNLLLADGQLAAAEEMYAELVDRAPDDPWGYLGRGKVARRRGRLPDAAALFEQAVGRAPEDREGTYLLAMTYRELGRRETALRQLDRLDSRSRAWPPDPLMELIRTGRHDLQSLVQVANRLLAEGNAEGAETLYRAVLDSEPGHFDALYNLGIVYGRQGRFTEAEASLEAAIRSRPDRTEPHFALAATYASQQQFEKADAELAAVLRLDPEHAGARSLLAGRRP